MPTFLFYILVAVVFLLMISVLVAAHEYGHYLFARIFKMGVEEFAIGMGKKLKVWKRKQYDMVVPDDYVHDPDAVSHGAPFEGGSISKADSELIETPTGKVLRETTEFTVRMFPIGGFVRIKGMVPQEDGSEVRIAGGFYSKPPLQRLIVLLAGPVFSIVAGMVLLLGIYMVEGTEVPDNRPVLKVVYEESEGKKTPAFKAGLRPGDEIVAVNGKSVDTMYDFIREVQANPDTPIPVVYSRGGKQTKTTVTPARGETSIYKPNLEGTMDTHVAGKIGILPGKKHIDLTFPQALARVGEIPGMAVEGIGRLIAKPSRLKREAGSAITMVQITGQATEQGFGSVLGVAAWISISVGIFNLLPVPPLDGGQMIMAFAEMLRGGRRLSIKVQQAVMSAGVMVILLFAALVFFFDINRQFENAGKPPLKEVSSSKPQVAP